MWPIFDCYSNMPLFAYRIRDVILECVIIPNKMKNKEKYHTAGTVLKAYINIVEAEAKSIP